MKNSYESALESLTVQPEKIRAFAGDFLADESWAALTETWGSEAPQFLYGYSFLVVKPETIARRLTRRTVDFVKQRGFTPVAHALLSIPRNAAHCVWRFQWNAATTDRIRLTNLVNAQSDSLFVVLRDTQPGAVPSCVKLWLLKGSAHADRRNSEHLRTALNMRNRMLGFVHTPDEPADLMRELSIFFEYEDVRRILLSAKQDRIDARTSHDSLNGFIECLEDRVHSHSVDRSEIMRRLDSSPQKALLSDVFSALAGGSHLPLDDVLEEFRRAGFPAKSWDALTIAAELIRHDKQGCAPLIDARAVTHVAETWLSRGSRLQSTLRATFDACRNNESDRELQPAGRQSHTSQDANTRECLPEM